MQEIKIPLTILNFPKQETIFQSQARFKIIAKGRRFGLTRGAANNFIEEAIKGEFKQGLWGDTINSNIDRYVERYFLPHLYKIPRTQWRWRQQSKVLEMFDSFIDFRSAERPEGWEGFGYDKVFLNEAGIILNDDYLWNNAIKPMLWEFKPKSVIGGCISEDSLVLSDGIKSIGSFSQERDNNTYIPLNEDLIGFGRNEATYFYSNGITNAIILKTLGGYKITGTPNHKLWTNQGWMRLDKIKKETKIAIFYGQNEWGDYEPEFKYKTNKFYRHLNPKLDAETAYLFGYLLGDGSVSHKRICANFHKDDEQIIDLLKKYKFTFSPKREDQMRLNSREYVEFFRFMGLTSEIAKNKTIPNKILTCDKEIVKQFISGLLDADGCARKTGNVTFASTSLKLVEQVMIVLLNFGIVSSHSKGFAPAHTGSRGFIRDSTLYTIHLNKFNSNLYGKLIGFRLDRKQKLITTSITDRYRTGKKEDNIFWTHLKSKEKVKVYTCDFVIPNTHSYISNGFMSHNTPKGLNLFYELAQRGQDPNQPDYEYFHFTSFDNPYLDHDALAEDMKSMPQAAIQQEIYAQFLEDSGVVFRGVKEVMTSKEEDPIKGHTYVMGVDLAKVQDFTVITVYDRKKNNQVYQERFNILDWVLQKKKIKEISRKYNNALVMLDATGLGDPIADDLIRDNIPVEPFKLTNQSKKELIEKLIIWIEQKKFFMLPLQETLAELASFTYDVTNRGRITYNAPAGFHDDIVISHALAIWGLNPAVEEVKTEPVSLVRQEYLRQLKGDDYEEGYF